jgi:hypothetical protein
VILNRVKWVRQHTGVKCNTMQILMNVQEHTSSNGKYACLSVAPSSVLVSKMVLRTVEAGRRSGDRNT